MSSVRIPIPGFRCTPTSTRRILTAAAQQGRLSRWSTAPTWSGPCAARQTPSTASSLSRSCGRCRQWSSTTTIVSAGGKQVPETHFGDGDSSCSSSLSASNCTSSWSWRRISRKSIRCCGSGSAPSTSSCTNYVRLSTSSPSRSCFPPAAGGLFFRSQPQHRMVVPFRNVRQRRRTRGRIVQLRQTHYEPKPDTAAKLPVSILGTGIVRRLVQSPRAEAEDLLRQIDWDKYKTGVPGVRWHPVGGFRVQFRRTRKDKNFQVYCSIYFRVGLYGFDEAKRRAIAYRKRLEQEWKEQEKIWRIMDTKKEIQRFQKQHATATAAADASVSVDV
ncbi:unnamed protein product [Amoebophrya sp. A25]|nr:unnamed protein product [Amoebophrya sp. A25]|eukprot:GSA25T00006014001.1